MLRSVSLPLFDLFLYTPTVSVLSYLGINEDEFDILAPSLSHGARGDGFFETWDLYL